MLKEQLVERKIDRRDFMRYSTLLGMSATAAYAFAGKVSGTGAVPAAHAADLPRGGILRIGMRVLEVETPHSYSWITDSNIGRGVHEYLTKTGQDNITRPYLVDSWEASDDLRTWTFKLRSGIKWHSGRPLTSDDALANLRHVLDPESGSSVIGLMKGYMLEEYDTGEKDDEGNAKMSVRLWDANALEKVDDLTFRMNLKVAQVAVPEHLFHYPLAILDPEEGWTFGVGSNGTGPFDLVEHEVGVKAALQARSDYWGKGPYLDRLEYIDLGDDPAALVGAIASKQVHGMYEGDIGQLDIMKAIPHAKIYSSATAATAVARVQIDRPEFQDARVRQALRAAIDPRSTANLALRELGVPAEHHHVCPIHPEYFELPFPERSVEKAKALLAEAGHPNGIDLEIACKKDPAWELNAVQAMVEQWKEANIRVNINLLPSAQFWDVWDKVPFGYTSWAHRPLGFMVLGLAYRSGVPWNEAHYANAEFDALLTKAEGTLDIEDRKQTMKELETIMQEDGPIVQPTWRAVYAAYDQRVKGFTLHPTLYIFGEELAIES
jgi:peptide/nickel transport system substrate-binding protein